MQGSVDIYIEVTWESREFPLRCWSFSDSPERIAIGRSSNNDVVLADNVVSRWHAEIVRIDSDWMFVVLGINGAYVNGRRGDSFPLWDGACVQLGQTGPHLSFFGTALRTSSGVMPMPKPQDRCVQESSTLAELEVFGGNSRARAIRGSESMVSRIQKISLDPSYC